MMKAILDSNEITITENWDIIKIIGTKEHFDGISVGDEIEYVPSWSGYKLTDLDRQMYDKGFRYKKILVMKNNEDVELTNELVPVYIDTATPISEGKMREDAGDLRFYWWNEDTQAWEEISYWIDNDTVNMSSTKVILRIPKVSASGYANVVVYYGAHHYGRKDDLTIAFGNRSNGGKYLSFDGIDDYVGVADDSSLNPTAQITIEAYFYLNVPLSEQGRWAAIVNKYDVSSSPLKGYYLEARSNDSLLIFAVRDSSGNIHAVDTSDIEPMRWYHVVAVYDGSEQKLYVNGELKDSNSWVGSLSIANVPLRLGVDGYNGRIGYVRIWNRALSDEEVQAIYDNPNDPPRAGLVLWLAPDSVDDANGKWLDKSGLGNDGTINGATPVGVRTFEESVQTSKVMSFDGVDDYVDLGDFIDNSFAVYVRFKANNDGEGHTLVCKHHISPGDYGWELAVYNGLGLEAKASVDGSLWEGVVLNNVLTDGEIADVVAVFDITNSTIKLYKNGGLLGSKTNLSGTTLHNSSVPVRIGTDGTIWHNDSIYRVMIWNRTLSDTEIQNLYNDPNNPPLDGLILWLDETSIDETNGKWLNKAPVLKSGYDEPLDGIIYGATPTVLVDSAWTDEIDMVERGVKIRWRGKVVKKVESGNAVVLYVKTYNLMKLTGEVS